MKGLPRLAGLLLQRRRHSPLRRKQKCLVSILFWRYRSLMTSPPGNHTPRAEAPQACDTEDREIQPGTRVRGVRTEREKSYIRGLLFAQHLLWLRLYCFHSASPRPPRTSPRHVAAGRAPRAEPRGAPPAATLLPATHPTTDCCLSCLLPRATRRLYTYTYMYCVGRRRPSACPTRSICVFSVHVAQRLLAFYTCTYT